MRYHLIGIGGTGMGALAGLLKAAGHEVRGSDKAVYPPMSEQLASMSIPVFEGFDPGNLSWGPDRVVVGNVCSKDHIEVVEAQQLGLELTSLPATLGEEFLAAKHSVVVAGTHGKTTTSSVLSHMLISAGRDPGCLIGGVPILMSRGWRLGQGDEFVVEGDEYDSAFFDKGSKFLHYRPTTAILTSVELDHVDIFSSMNAVRETFRKFVRLLPENGLLVVARDSREAMAIAEAESSCSIQTYAVEGRAGADQADWVIKAIDYRSSGRCQFELYRHGELFGNFETLMSGEHNLANLAACIAITHSLGVPVADIRAGVSSFAGVRRRQEIRGIAQGVTIIDDYGHHPTAIAETLQALRHRYPGRRLHALYEPRSATSRRKTFQREFASAFSHADTMAIGKLFSPDKIPKEERFDPERLALDLHQSGTPARFIPDVGEMVANVAREVRPGEVVIVFSSGSFEGIHDRLLAALGDAVMPARLRDLGDIANLLESEGLLFSPVSEDDLVHFLVLRNEHGFSGCVSLEVFSEEAILSSLAIPKQARGIGYGWLLADAVLQTAKNRGVRRIYLLTETASDFFAAKLGFRVVDLTTIADAVSASRTFRSQEGRSPVAMRLDL
ncbi:MAG: GNAT family N-acetyltransferase [Deltaproteobacteria bacterium]|nr:GNAT family N-acetyltransferase [Deltaproteobacteria bacterium]